MQRAPPLIRRGLPIWKSAVLLAFAATVSPGVPSSTAGQGYPLPPQRGKAGFTEGNCQRSDHARTPTIEAKEVPP